MAGSPAGDGAQPLDGAVVSGPLYLGLAGSPPAPVEPCARSTWTPGCPATTSRSPFLVGPVDASALGPGEHGSQVIVYFTDGRLLTVNATFRVP